jgi:Zn-dependent protease
LEFTMLGSSLRLFNVAGTDVRVHPTFFFLLAWIGAVYWMRGGAGAALHGLIFISLLFVCVVLHEFGHIFAARRSSGYRKSPRRRFSSPSPAPR